MARIPQPEPVRSNFSNDIAERYELLRDGPDLSMFEEPDHTPELATQNAYEDLRTNPWLGTDDEPPTVARAVTAVNPQPVDSALDNRQGSGQKSDQAVKGARYCTFCANGFHTLCTGSGGATNPPRDPKKPDDGLARTCECGDANHHPGQRVLDAMARYRGY